MYIGWWSFLLATGKFKENDDEAENDQATFNKLTNKKTSPGEIATRPQDKQETWLVGAGITDTDDIEAILSALKQLQGKNNICFYTILCIHPYYSPSLHPFVPHITSHLHSFHFLISYSP
jgi:hypothetical protein